MSILKYNRVSANIDLIKNDYHLICLSHIKMLKYLTDLKSKSDAGEIKAPLNLLLRRKDDFSSTAARRRRCYTYGLLFETCSSHI